MYTSNNLDSLILVVGVSGAGKASTARSLSDQGYHTLDNFPVKLIPNFLELAGTKDTDSRYKHIAIIPEIPNLKAVNELIELLTSIRQDKFLSQKVRLIFLNCQTGTLLTRYSETRRAHPWFDPSLDNSLSDTIVRERSMLKPVRHLADKVIDTSDFMVNRLREQLKLYISTLVDRPVTTVFVTIISFGFKYGVPRQCDLQIDVRFVKNPYWEPHLSSKTGLTKEVSEYVLSHKNCQLFMGRYLGLLNFLLPLYKSEGKSYINIGVGCTGGKHRSVAIAEELGKRLSYDLGKNDFDITVQHRDVGKE